MAKWFGKVGYAETEMTVAGLWEENITERSYFGDVYRNTRTIQNSGEINDNVNIGMQISIVADPFAKDHFHAMRYAEYAGTFWKITSVEVQYPRLILQIGGIWNGNVARTAE